MIEPITATPSAPPTWRVTSLIAEPTPALASGTALMTESVAGAIAAPIDRARPKVTRASSAGADHEAQRERQHRRARLQRAVAVRELQELREGEDRAHHREEDERDAER